MEKIQIGSSEFSLLLGGGLDKKQNTQIWVKPQQNIYGQLFLVKCGV